MIPRYTRPEMGRIWSDQNKFQQWLEVELAASEALARAGRRARRSGAPAARARRLRCGAHPRNRKRSEARRHRLHHRGGRNHGRRAGMREASRWFHYGLTSNDVVDTAQALLLQQASAILLSDLKQLARGAQAARAGVPAHGADRPHARSACRADHVRAEAGHLVRRGRAQSQPAAARRPKTCGSARSRARWARSRTSARRPRS